MISGPGLLPHLQELVRNANFPALNLVGLSHVPLYRYFRAFCGLLKFEDHCLRLFSQVIYKETRRIKIDIMEIVIVFVLEYFKTEYYLFFKKK